MDNRAILNLAVLLLLALATLYTATKYGFIHCSVLPHWCSVYTQVNTLLLGRTYPNIAILSSGEGLGDPGTVAEYIRKTCGYRAVVLPADTVTLGNLQSYDVVIVEKARTLSATQLEMLWDYTAGGGKLALIGDVRVEAPREEEYLTWEDLGEENREIIV